MFLRPRLPAAAPAVAMGLALALAGCVGVQPPPPPRPLPDLPAAWSEGGQAGAGAITPSDWWRRFDDPTLTALVERALHDNTRIAAADAALAQARALRTVAEAALGPTLAGSASARRNTGGGGTSNSFQAGLDAQWAPDVFGAGRYGAAAAADSANASAATLGDVRLRVAGELALDYVLLRSTQARRAIATDNLAAQRETLQITAWRRQAGLVSELDTEQALAAAEQTQALLPALDTAIAQAAHALALLTGQAPGALMAMLATPGPLPLDPAALDTGIPADALRQRADVRAAEFEVAAAWSRLGQAQARRRPGFALGGSIGVQALTLGALTNGSAVLGTLLSSVSLPLWDGGALRAQADAQAGALAQAEALYRGVVLGALKEVEDALVALRGDRERLARLDLAAGAATRAATLARQRYDGGLADFQAVLDTQRTRLATQDGLASASADVAGDQVRLFQALGGGWRLSDTVAQVAPLPEPLARETR